MSRSENDITATREAVDGYHVIDLDGMRFQRVDDPVSGEATYETSDETRSGGWTVRVIVGSCRVEERRVRYRSFSDGDNGSGEDESREDAS